MAFPIGELARQTAVKVPTIRYYEQIGLLAAPPRSAGNRRLYGQAEVERLRFIRHSRELGFEIEDIRELLAMAGQPQASCHQADSIARNHLGEIEPERRAVGIVRDQVAAPVAGADPGIDLEILQPGRAQDQARGFQPRQGGLHPGSRIGGGAGGGDLMRSPDHANASGAGWR